MPNNLLQWVRLWVRQCITKPDAFVPFSLRTIWRGIVVVLCLVGPVIAIVYMYASGRDAYITEARYFRLFSVRIWGPVFAVLLSGFYFGGVVALWVKVVRPRIEKYGLCLAQLHINKKLRSRYRLPPPTPIYYVFVGHAVVYGFLFFYIGGDSYNGNDHLLLRFIVLLSYLVTASLMWLVVFRKPLYKYSDIEKMRRYLSDILIGSQLSIIRQDDMLTPAVMASSDSPFPLAVSTLPGAMSDFLTEILNRNQVVEYTTFTEEFSQIVRGYVSHIVDGLVMEKHMLANYDRYAVTIQSIDQICQEHISGLLSKFKLYPAGNEPAEDENAKRFKYFLTGYVAIYTFISNNDRLRDMYHARCFDGRFDSDKLKLSTAELARIDARERACGIFDELKSDIESASQEQDEFNLSTRVRNLIWCYVRIDDEGGRMSLRDMFINAPTLRDTLGASSHRPGLTGRASLLAHVARQLPPIHLA